MLNDCQMLRMLEISVDHCHQEIKFEVCYYTILYYTVLYYTIYTILNYIIAHCLHSKAWQDCSYQCSPWIITCTARHGQNLNAGAGPQSLLPRWGMAILYYTILYYSTLLAQRGMARLCVPVCSSVITCTARHGQNEYYTTIAQCLHSEAWLDCTFVAPQLDWPKTLYSRIPWVENTSILNTYSGMEEYGGNTCLAPSRPQIPQQCRQLNP